MIISTKAVDFADRLREFRTERLSVIKEGQVPGELMKGARLVLHIVPAKAFDEEAQLDFTSFKLETDSLQPMYSFGSQSIRHNFDGMLRVAKRDNQIYSYAQLFWNGVIESVNTSMLETEDEKPTIPCPLCEQEVMGAVKNSLNLLKELGVEAPLFIMLSLLSVKGYTMAVSGVFRHGSITSVDRDDLLVPAVKVESYDVDIYQAMRPAFNRVWNAAGWARSRSYDENGNWNVR
jgi:hypothetical protein